MQLTPPQRLDGRPLTVEARRWYGRALNVTAKSTLSIDERRDVARRAFGQVSAIIDGRWTLTVGHIADGRFLPA